MDPPQLLNIVLGLLQQIKLFHWSTMSFAKHKALDELHSTLSDKLDMFVESYLGRTKGQPLKKFTVQVSSHTDTSKIEKYLEGERDKLRLIADKAFADEPQLQNIIHDIMSEIDQALYLCRLS